MHITEPQTCSVMSLEADAEWREKRPYGDVPRQQDWLHALEVDPLPELVNPEAFRL
ncbi:hypothetical protein MF271_23615 (plasmid) [Deinococcus sp. KNUC1210]|uniref:hypothetical protein n=1 Tax=Deinococcus sp. KNUC1210 TaxID=2917691 RepID=UPI001EF0EF84|nr:hypothetical protein [Deinococcus sp. KNUC1210]ULH17953.1 hypothetical protein MF271_23615 [Deinococcus sp. KNUC1210]